ncbi:MAG: hypothetical protein V3R98_11120, partial [Alphaproteobacteria bacterium]
AAPVIILLADFMLHLPSLLFPTIICKEIPREFQSAIGRWRGCGGRVRRGRIDETGPGTAGNEQVYEDLGDDEPAAWMTRARESGYREPATIRRGNEK